MLNNKITGLLTAAALTTLTAMTTFAATPAAATIPATAVVPAATVDDLAAVPGGEPASYAITVSKTAQGGAVQGELKTDATGKQYFVTKDGETVYITAARLPGEAGSAAYITVTPSGK